MIAVFFDSNIFFSENGYDYSRSWILQRAETYSDLVELADVYDEVKFVISEVVVRETHRSQCEKYKNKTDDLKRIVLPDWKFEYDASVANYSDWLQDHFDKHCKHGSFGMVQFVVAPIPEACFRSIVERGLEKRAPFEGKSKASDKGFKDALIWETLLQYKRDNRADEIVLITNDDRMSGESIKMEYKKEFNGEAITICSGREDFQEFLNALNNRRGVDAGLPLAEVEDSSRVNDFLRTLVFYNMEAIAEAGGLSYRDDTTYNLKPFCIEEDDRGYPRYVSVLWSTSFDGDSAHCSIEFRVTQANNGVFPLCLINNRAIEIEYDEDSMEAIGYEI